MISAAMLALSPFVDDEDRTDVLSCSGGLRRRESDPLVERPGGSMPNLRFLEE